MIYPKSLFFTFRKALVVTLLLFLSGQILAQNEIGGEQKKMWKDYKLQPIFGLQMWSTYTFQQERYNAEKHEYESVDNRLNLQLRRARLGLKGQLYPQLKFNITTSLDLVGRDLLSATEGGSNNGASPSFRLWHAYLQYQLGKGKENLHFTVGYFAPVIGRESITSALRSPSMEKAWTQSYLRRHLVGTNPGRAFGLNVGGLLLREKENIQLSYDLGLFTPVYTDLNANSMGNTASPLLVGRTSLDIGDPEQTTYSLGHKVNYFGSRYGLSIALALAYQGPTNLFQRNYAYGADFLFNWGDFNLDGEWMYLGREKSAEDLDISAQTAHIRLSYNIKIAKNSLMEPTVMWAQFAGEMDLSGQQKAKQLASSAGKDQYVDIGVNYYFNPDLKLSLHYTIRNGDAGAAGNGAVVNNYFYQGGVGAILRGNWVGLGIVTIL